MYIHIRLIQDRLSLIGKRLKLGISETDFEVRPWNENSNIIFITVTSNKKYDGPLI